MEGQRMDARTCKTCACVFVIERPAVQPPGMDAQTWDNMPREQYVCRLNPPVPMQTPKGLQAVQMPTTPGSVCWQWRAVGTLPGDQHPLAA